MSSTYIQIGIAFDARIEIPSAVLPPILAPKDFSKCPSRQQAGKTDHTDFVQVEPQDFQCLTMSLATCVVVDVSRSLDILTWEVSAMLERLLF